MTTSGPGFSDPSFQVFGLRGPLNRKYMTTSGAGFSDPSFQVFGLQAPPNRHYMTTSGAGFSDPSFQVFGLRAPSHSQYLTTSGAGFSDPSFHVFGLQAPPSTQYLTTSGRGYSDPSFQVPGPGLSDPSFQVFGLQAPSNLQYKTTSGAGFSDPSFQVFGVTDATDFGCTMRCGIGFGSLCFGNSGFSCGPIQMGCVTPCNSGLSCSSFCGFGFPNVWPACQVNCQPVACNFGYSYGLPYDMSYGWGWMPSWSRWGANYRGDWPTNYVETTSSSDYPVPSKPQVIHFDKPLAPGSASIRIESPSNTEVLVQGKRVSDVYMAENLNGPTKIDFTVRQTSNGQTKDVAHPVMVSPGDRKQLVILR